MKHICSEHLDEHLCKHLHEYPHEYLHEHLYEHFWKSSPWHATARHLDLRHGRGARKGVRNGVRRGVRKVFVKGHGSIAQI